MSEYMATSSKLIKSVLVIGLAFFVFAGSLHAASDPLQAPPPQDPGLLANAVPADAQDADEANSRVKVWGKYRVAFGVSDEESGLILNDSNADLQDFDDNWLFGERLNNTYDPAIYSQYLVNINVDATDQLSFYTQLVADPWSYSGVTSEIIVPNVGGSDHFRVKLKYWGNNDSIMREIWRSDDTNSAAFPVVEVKDGKTIPFTVLGFTDYGTSYTIPATEIDYEFRPVRKAWMDYKAENWNLRVFAVADQSQVMTTDDPLGLSNAKDYWMASPWLDTYEPVMHFSDGSIRRGRYNGSLAFNTKDSEGNYLTLLRGASFEGDFGQTYVGATVASPFSPWDEYHEFNNVPGVVRVKHQVTPQWMVGTLYGFRQGMVDGETDSWYQVFSNDTRYFVDPETELYGQWAFSRNEYDILAGGVRGQPDGLADAHEGFSYRAGINKTLKINDSESRMNADFTWMDSKFRSQLSRYSQMRDDNFWDKHYVSFTEYSPDLEYYRLGRGVDIGRYVGRFNIQSTFLDEKVNNLFDVRHVRNSDSNSFIENVIRDEITYQFHPQWKAKGATRWQLLPETLSDQEPFLTDFVFLDQPNLATPTLENTLIDPGLDPSRFTIGGGLQYEHNEQWTFDATYTASNDIPDFPRGLQNNTYRNSSLRDDQNQAIMIDRITNFLYRQDIYDLPPYEYFSIIHEKVTYQPQENLAFTFHAAQNSYKLWQAVDGAVNHQGISAEYNFDEKTSIFMDYTHARTADIPHLISSNYTELNFRDHHNIYSRLTRKIGKSARLVAEYGVFGQNVMMLPNEAAWTNPYVVSDFSLKTIDTEHIIRVAYEGEF